MSREPTSAQPPTQRRRRRFNPRVKRSHQITTREQILRERRSRPKKSVPAAGGGEETRKLYKGPRGGTFYFTKRSKIYI